jgi:hypothetical protein
VLFFFLVFFANSSLIFAKSYQSGGTGYIGGVTLFDESSPFMLLNNPGLISDYHRIRFKAEGLLLDPNFRYTGFTEREEMTVDPLDAAYDPTGFLPRYGFGRLFLPSFYIGIGASEDTFEASKYLIGTLGLGLLTNGGGEVLNIAGLFDINLSEITKIFTFGLLDISPMFSNATVSLGEKISNVLQVTKSGSVGIANTININILGYYHNTIGFSLYFTSDIKVGLYGEEMNALVINDPTLDVDVETGMALSIGFGKIKLPLLGYSYVGATLRFFGAFSGHSESIDDALLMALQITNYVGHIDTSSFNNILSSFTDFSYFGAGEYVKAGAGVALDLGFHKKVDKYTTVAGKISDIVSPTYWLNTKAFSVWKDLPNISLGLKHEFRLSKKWWMLMNKPTIFFQVDDMLYTDNLAFMSKLHVGVSSRFFFDFLELGVGLNQGYPTVGFTFHVTPAILAKIPVVKYLFYVTAPVTFFHFKFNLTAYGRELGRYPGESGFLGYNVGLDLYIGF